MIRSNYVVEVCNIHKIIIRDVGPWDQYMSVTNDAENVIIDLAEKLKGLGNRRVFYYDSEGDYSELQHNGEYFTGFGPVFDQSGE